MSAKIKVTREQIVEAALGLVREGSDAALSARSLAARLGCSTQPIFSNFPNMQGLLAAVIARAWKLYLRRTEEDMSAGGYPPYKASGMSYITFAREEPQLFRLLFMRDRTDEDTSEYSAHPPQVIRVIMRQTGMSEAEAIRFHDKMWIFVHGLAVMTATGFASIDEAEAGEMLSDVYNGLRREYQAKGVIPDDGDRDQGTDETI